MTKTVCRICLRSDVITTADLDESLAEFYDEIIDYETYFETMLALCSTCKYKLKKFYNYKQACQRALSILKKNKSKVKKGNIENLYELLPEDPIGFSTNNRRGMFYCKEGHALNTLQDSTEDHTECVDHTPYFVSTPLPVNLPLKTDKSKVTLNIESKINDFKSTNDNRFSKEIKYEQVTTNLVLETNEIAPNTENISQIDEIKAENENLDDEIKAENENLDDDLQDINVEELFDQMTFEVDKDEDLKCTSEELYILEVDSQKNEDTNSNTGSDFDETFQFNSDNDDDDNDDREKPSSKTVKKDQELNQYVDNSKSNNKKNAKNILSGNNVSNQNQKNKSLEQLSSKKFGILNNLPLTDLSLEELRLIRSTLSKPEKKYLKRRQGIENFKEHVVNLLEQGKIDLGEKMITKEQFLDMFAKCDITRMHIPLTFNRGAVHTMKIKKFLLSLLTKKNPEYETVFEIEYLTTHAMKVAEFQARKNRKEYLEAAYKCEKCFKPFDLQKLLDYHNKWHDPNRAHECDICLMRFASRAQLRSHHRNCHDSVYKCKLCGLYTYVYDVMVNHFHQHNGVKYTCDICSSNFFSQSSLNTHRLSHARHPCSYCARRFVSPRGLASHITHKHKDATPSASLACDECDAVFQSQDILDKHQRIHTSSVRKLFKCGESDCGERFSTASELRSHIASLGHTKRIARPYSIYGCALRKKASSGKAIANKARIEVSESGEPYRTCPVCAEKVPYKSSVCLYKHHMLKHPDKPYETVNERTSLCEHCGKAFVHHSVYLEHLNTHTGAKPYECAECGAKFALRRAYALHRERHRPPRYQCPDCGKKFPAASNLFLHRRIHIGDRRFKCEVCSKGFLHASTLKEHVNGVHNQIRKIKKQRKTVKESD